MIWSLKFILSIIAALKKYVELFIAELRFFDLFALLTISRACLYNILHFPEIFNVFDHSEFHQVRLINHCPKLVKQKINHLN